MCATQELAKSKIERLIEAMDRLSANLERLLGPDKQNDSFTRPALAGGDLQSAISRHEKSKNDPPSDA